MHKLNGLPAVLCAALLLTGCGKWPPVTRSARDVLALPASTQEIRARFLGDDDFASLSHLPQLRHLDFHGGYARGLPGFTDKGLATLASLDLPHLQHVSFGHCSNITDASLPHILKLKPVTALQLLACPGITDAGLQTLAGMTNLTYLDLRGCPNITDKGLAHLAAKTNWRHLSFGGCPQVTPAAVAELQRRFPGANIVKDDEEWSYHTK